MIEAFIFRDKSLTPVPANALSQHLHELTWIDLHHPTKEEENAIETLLNASIPTREEMREIELSNRLYMEDGHLFATASLMSKAESCEPEIHAVTFILIGNCLVTVRYADPLPFQAYIKNVSKLDDLPINGADILTGLQQAIVNRLADILEIAGHHIDGVMRTIFRPAITDKEELVRTKPDYQEVLRRIGIDGDLTSKARESLVSVSRLLSFISQTNHFRHHESNSQKIQMMLRDIQALNDHASFLNNKSSFLLNATLGLISMDQNNIIKIFSVAAVVLLPPTLVASIYGMNFEYMPELHWHLGYPLTLILMVFSAFLPYRYFKKRGWL